MDVGDGRVARPLVLRAGPGECMGGVTGSAASDMRRASMCVCVYLWKFFNEANCKL